MLLQQLLTHATHRHSMQLILPWDGDADGEPTWVKLNAGQHVPLRVAYPAAMMTTALARACATQQV
jgi:hypothetical protein